MINYKILNDSVIHYQEKGFERVEVPWLVSQEVAKITIPDHKSIEDDYIIKRNDKVLVASGEQSFLYQYLKEFLPKGKFQTITPCFRNESFDFTHSKYFMKNELIRTDNVNLINLNKMIVQCAEFFDNYLENVEIIKIDENSSDIVANINNKQYELGSYGIRSCEYLDWIYGTGVAEPRLSKLIKLQEKNGLSY